MRHLFAFLPGGLRLGGSPGRSGRIRCARVAGAWILVVMLMVVVPPTAGAASAGSLSVPGWTIEPTPNPSGAIDSPFLGVSCTSASACIAVGDYFTSFNPFTGGTLAESWDGTSWAIQPTPTLAGATYSQLLGVSCTSASACTAVGFYVDSSGVGVTLAERWDGSTWAIQPTPNPAGAQGISLSGVSCTSASACIAVGSYRNSSGVGVTLVERWDGSTWAIQPTPNPAGAQFSGLIGVSCTSASACTAVGTYVNSSGVTGTLAERGNGSTWAIQPTPTPAGATYSQLLGVSCTSSLLTRVCTAVGYYENSAGSLVTLAERRNGSTWAIQPTQNALNAKSSELRGVSCTSASACTAIGDYTINNTNTTVTLAERWNGIAWLIQPTPNPAGAPLSDFAGVSCTSASACTAVGTYYNSAFTRVTLAERYS